MENILVELSEEGVVAVHADVGQTCFVNLISPAIIQLDEAIQHIQSVISSEVFKQTMQDAAEKLAAVEEEAAVA